MLILFLNVTDVFRNPSRTLQRNNYVDNATFRLHHQADSNESRPLNILPLFLKRESNNNSSVRQTLYTYNLSLLLRNMIDNDLFYIRSNCYRATWSNYISAVNKNNKSNSNFLAVWPRRFLNKCYATITCNYLIDLLAIISAWKYWHGDTGCLIMETAWATNLQ